MKNERLQNWLRNRSTIEFDGIKNQAGSVASRASATVFPEALEGNSI